MVERGEEDQANLERRLIQYFQTEVGRDREMERQRERKGDRGREREPERDTEKQIPKHKVRR